MFLCLMQHAGYAYCNVAGFIFHNWACTLIKKRAKKKRESRVRSELCPKQTLLAVRLSRVPDSLITNVSEQKLECCGFALGDMQTLHNTADLYLFLVVCLRSLCTWSLFLHGLRGNERKLVLKEQAHTSSSAHEYHFPTQQFIEVVLPDVSDT